MLEGIPSAEIERFHGWLTHIAARLEAARRAEVLWSPTGRAQGSGE
jgi:hypothetical protein